MPDSSTILDCMQRCEKLDEECRAGGRSIEECERQRARCENICPYT